jgi:hypothetical protein
VKPPISWLISDRQWNGSQRRTPSSVALICSRNGRNEQRRAPSFRIDAQRVRCKLKFWQFLERTNSLPQSRTDKLGWGTIVFSVRPV